MRLLKDLIKPLFTKKFCQLVDPFTMQRMSEVDRCTGVGYKSDTETTYEVLSGLFYLNCWNKSYMINMMTQYNNLLTDLIHK